MDELATRCQNQLASFRITELKHVLSRLGLSKQGKKQILMDKIMEVLVPAETTPSKIKGSKMSKNAVSREEAANVIDDIYRKLRNIGAPDLGLAGRSRVVAGVSGSMAQSDEQEEVVGWDEAKTRCPCGNSVDKGTMIQVTCCFHWFLIVLLWKQDTAHPIFVSKMSRISRCASLIWKFS
jgi:hypothetical protein